MEELIRENKKDFGFERLDIYCLRILAEKVLKDTPILFNVSEGCVVPIDICLKPSPCPEDIEKKAAKTIAEESLKLKELIDSDAPTHVLLRENEKLAKLICSLKPSADCLEGEVKCIEDIKVICLETSEDFICNSKVRLHIKFKVSMTVKLMGECFDIIRLPEDAGKKICFNNVTFPIVYSCDGIRKTLDLSDGFFCLTIEIPLKDFNCKLPSYIFDDPTLQSHIRVKCIKHDFEICVGVCCCDPEARTHILLLSTADVIDKIGVYQDIWLYGKPDL